MNKALSDTVPNQFAQAYGILVNAGITGGIFASNFLGVLIPLEEEGQEAMLADTNWRVVYGFPILLALYTILVTTFKFKKLSISDLLKDVNDSETALKEIRKVYRC